MIFQFLQEMGHQYFAAVHAVRVTSSSGPFVERYCQQIYLRGTAVTHNFITLVNM
jgi:hypothetical protein